MGDRGIIFSAPMVRALLAGTKTQTRRVLKPQPFQTATGWGCVDRAGAPQKWLPSIPGLTPYTPGDRLWVREAHYLTDTGDYEIAVYAEDAVAVQEHIDLINSVASKHGLPDTWKTPHLKLRPSIHMPRWASRLTLTVTDVRVQRLQEISEADAWAEGCKRGDPDDVGGFFPAEELHPKGGWVGWDCAVDWYADLWDSLHGPDAWDTNPWVVAVSFAVRQGNIDTDTPTTTGD